MSDSISRDTMIKSIYKSIYINSGEDLSNLILAITRGLVDDRAKRRVVLDALAIENELEYFKVYTDRRGIEGMELLFIPVILANKNKEARDEECMRLAEALERISGTLINYSPYRAVFISKLVLASMEVIEENCSLLIADIFSDDEMMEAMIDEASRRAKDALIHFNPQGCDDMVELLKLKVKIMSHSRKYIEDFFGMLSELINYNQGITEENSMTSKSNDESDIEGESGVDMSMESKNNTPGKFKIDTTKGKRDRGEKMAEYIISLRSYAIGREYATKKANPLAFISLKEGEGINDPVFSQITVLRRVLSDDRLEITFTSRAGVYTMRYRRKRER